jgi:hypothetical protein
MNSEGLVESVYEINNGLCSEVASDVVAELGGETDDFGTIGVANLRKPPCEDDCPFDRRLLKKYWNTAPPPGLAWKDLDRLEISDVEHDIIHLASRFHDADVPEGVDCLFDLPIFRRRIARAVTEHMPELPDRMKDDPWWKETMREWTTFKEWWDGRDDHRPLCWRKASPPGP